MSSYITAQGQLFYGNTADLDKVIHLLVEGDWLKKKAEGYVWIDEANREISDTNSVGEGALGLTIPNSVYLNLSKVMDDITADAIGGRVRYFEYDDSCRLIDWHNGNSTTIDKPAVIAMLAQTKEEIDLDSLNMDSEQWEAKYDDDFYGHRTNVMLAAFERM
jgi:hypothetical protein